MGALVVRLSCSRIALSGRLRMKAPGAVMHNSYVSRSDVGFDVAHGTGDIAVKHIPDHSAMSDRLGVLAGDEPQHAVA